MRRRRNLRRVPTTEEKPEVPFSRVLREIRDPFWEPLLRRFASGIGHLAVQNRVPAKLEIGQKTFVCLLLCVLFFWQPRFRAGRWTYGSLFRKKRRSKTGTCTDFCRGSRPFPVSDPIRLIRGRWHSPQVAPAAPPAPRVHSSSEKKLCFLITKPHVMDHFSSSLAGLSTCARSNRINGLPGH